MMRQVEKNEVVMCLNSPTLPFLPCFITFCSTHSYTSYFYEIFATCSCTFFITKVYFFYVDYGILNTVNAAILLEKVVIIESAIYTYTYVHAHKSYTAYATRLVFFCTH